MTATQPRKMRLAIRFKVKIDPRGAIVVPKTAAAKLSSAGAMMIEGAIDSSPFRAELKPDAAGVYRLEMGEAMREALGVRAGEAAAVEITRVGDEPETRVPADLDKAFAASPKARASWSDITPMARRDWIFSISTAKQAETRRRRIEKACDMLASGKRRLCCFPGIKWMMEKNAEACGMWLPLANTSKKS